MKAILALAMVAQAAAVPSGGQTGTDHRAIARGIAARSGFETTYALQCRTEQGLPPQLRDRGVPPPTKLFDDLFFVGTNSVGAYVVRTSQGLILIDSLNNAEQARTVIVPGMIALGLDPKALKYVLITHGHGDHYGGASWIAKTYGTRVVASAVDWDVMEKAKAGGASPFDPPPQRDMVARDGEAFRLGDTSIQVVATPGHTPGTLSFLIPVRYHGVKHMLGMWGGTGIPAEAAARADYIRSLDRFVAISARYGADAELSNHPFVDDGVGRMASLRAAPKGDNPFVVGRQRYADYMAVMKNCAQARDAGAPGQLP